MITASMSIVSAGFLGGAQRADGHQNRIVLAQAGTDGRVGQVDDVIAKIDVILLIISCHCVVSWFIGNG